MNLNKQLYVLSLILIVSLLAISELYIELFSNFNAQSHQLIIALIIFFILVLCLVIVWVRHFVLKPVLLLKNTIAEFSVDNARMVSMPVTQDNEIGLLAASFEDMMQHVVDSQRHLYQLNTDLEEMVSTRSHELKFAKQKQRTISECIAECVLTFDRDYVIESINKMDLDGNHIYVAIIKDVGEHKKAEELLMQAHDQVQQAARDKSEFLSTMSHEIRTPLNGVLGMADLLKNTSLGTEQKNMLDMIQDSGHILLGVINDVLDLSRAEAGKMDLKCCSVQMESLAYRVLMMTMIRANEAGIDLVLDYDNDCPRYFMGDATRIKQVLLNLISNAIKFTEQGSVILRFSYEATDSGSHELQIFVQDTGIGIPQQQQEKLFNLFTQTDSSTTRKFGGAGLGLASCKKIVDLMGGRIGVDSTVGVGSSFWIELPLQCIDEGVDEGPREDQVLFVCWSLIVIVISVRYWVVNCNTLMFHQH
ncbi:MAG: hypothetical protein GXP22_11570 [Gammaproteobacteria bacterium]|nr:hypothetical protein [Gammaproteobacteria bacterium]